jgi:hypothetical protein
LKSDVLKLRCRCQQIVVPSKRWRYEQDKLDAIPSTELLRVQAGASFGDEFVI